MSGCNERLNELLFDGKVSPKQLSQDMGVSLSTVYRWKNDTNFRLSKLIALADYFRCSVDYILCLTEDCSDYAPKQCPQFYKRLRVVMREKGVSTYNLRKNTKFGGFLYEWERGADPLASTLIELANILDCSVDYLIGRE